MKKINTNEMVGRETKVWQKTINIKEVIFEKLEEDAS